MNILSLLVSLLWLLLRISHQRGTKMSAKCPSAGALYYGYIADHNQELLRYACTDFLASGDERMCRGR